MSTRRCWTASLSLILLLLIGGGSVAETPLRIMTYNGQWLTGSPAETNSDPWTSEQQLSQHYAAVAGVIKRLNPDIVNIVEITSAASKDRLLQALAAQGVTRYRAYHRDLSDSNTGQDLAVLSAIPLEAIDGEEVRHFYSTAMGQPWRAEFCNFANRCDDSSISKNIVYFVRVGQHRLGFLGLHLIAGPGNEGRDVQRGAQAKVAQKIIRDEIVARGAIPIVLGDLNDYDTLTPDASNSRSSTPVLRWIMNYNFTTPDPELYNPAKGLPQAKRYTAAFGQSTMIDFILLHRSLGPHFRKIDIPHATASGASDHWPVVVDLRLP
jgi:hypothetical protein